MLFVEETDNRYATSACRILFISISLSKNADSYDSYELKCCNSAVYIEDS